VAFDLGEAILTLKTNAEQLVSGLASGEKADLDQQVDLLPPKGPWTVTVTESAKPDGKKEYVCDAQRSFARAADIPPNFATAETRFPNAYLQTPVQFQMRDEGNANVYEFTVTYKARRWKEYEDLLPEIAGPRLTELVNRYGADKLTPAEKLAYFTAYVRWQLRLIYDYFAAPVTKAAGSGGLSTEKAQGILKQIEGAFDSLATEDAVRKIMAQPEAEWGKGLDEKKKLAKTEADKILEAALHSPKESADRQIPQQDAATLAKIRDGVAEATLEWDVTTALSTQSFTVKIHMPGAINKTSAEKVEGNCAEWNFGPEKFRDVDGVMSVTSKRTK